MPLVDGNGRPLTPGEVAHMGSRQISTEWQMPPAAALALLKRHAIDRNQALAKYEAEQSLLVSAARTARRSGVPMQQIADAMGLHRTRVHALIGDEPTPTRPGRKSA